MCVKQKLMPFTGLLMFIMMVVQCSTIFLGSFFFLNPKIMKKHPYGLFTIQLILAAFATNFDIVVLLFASPNYYTFLVK